MVLSISIVNWNACEELRLALRSIFEKPPQLPYEVIVFDNASCDGSVEMIQEEFPQVRLLRSHENLGFARAHNRAMQQAQGRYLLVLNPDTQVMGDALQKLLEFADANPQVGIIGPQLLNPDGSLQYSCRHFPDPVAAIFRNTPLGRLFPHNRYTRHYLMTDWDHQTIREVDWVSGAAMLIRRELIEQIGLFDERFFMYCEDMDLCYRAWQAGWKVLYYPEAVIVHTIGRSTDKAVNKMIRAFHVSMYRFYRKHYVSRTPFFLRPLILPGILLRASLFILKNYKDALIRWWQRRRKIGVVAYSSKEVMSSANATEDFHRHGAP